MAVTLDQLRARAATRADLTQPLSALTFVSKDEMTDFVNDAYRALWSDVIALMPTFAQKHFDFAIASTADLQNFTAVPADFREIRDVVLDPTLGNRRSLPDFDAVQSGNSRERSYRLSDQTLWIEPREAATGNYRLWYTPEPAELVADTDAVLAELAQFQDVIVLGAAILALSKSQDDISTLGALLGSAKTRVTTWAARRRQRAPARVQDVRGVSRARGGQVVIVR